MKNKKTKKSRKKSRKKSPKLCQAIEKKLNIKTKDLGDGMVELVF